LRNEYVALRVLRPRQRRLKRFLCTLPSVEFAPIFQRAKLMPLVRTSVQAAREMRPGVAYILARIEAREAAGLPEPPDVHDAAYWEERRVGYPVAVFHGAGAMRAEGFVNAITPWQCRR
jgi:hypothetical protein